jgi:hypothetical protein
MKRANINLPIAALMKPNSQSTRLWKKHVATLALMVNVGVTGVFAQESPINMRFSGTGAASAIDLKQPNTRTGEQNVAGDSALGPFTFRIVRASATSPQPSGTCSGLYIPTMAGGGLFRFQDGSLLMVNITQGGDCIDLAANVGHCTLTFQITGGTGRFNGASGSLTLTETALPVLADATNNPILFTEAGEIKGTVSGVALGEDAQSVRR